MDAPVQPRNHVIDTARAVSVLVVVLFHSLLYQVRTVNNRPTLIPWAPPVLPWWPLSWILMVIPIFFIAGGFAHAVLIDKGRWQGIGYASFLANRGRRIMVPLTLFVTVCAVVFSVIAWAGDIEMAAHLSAQLMQLLWFLSVYLIIVACTPLLVAGHDRFGGCLMIPTIIAALGVDAWSFAVDDHQIRNINMLLVWPLVHQFGIAYHRGWFQRTRSRAWAAVGVGITVILVMVCILQYPGSAVGFADIPYANVQPPTSAMIFLAVAQCGVLALIDRSGVLSRMNAQLQKVVATINALMMSVYLWHIVCIALAAGGLFALSVVFPPGAPFFLHQLTVAVVTGVAVAGVVPLIAQLEVRLVPSLSQTPDASITIGAFSILVFGTIVVWQTGTVIHPAQPWSTVGVIAMWIGATAMRWGARGLNPQKSNR